MSHAETEVRKALETDKLYPLGEPDPMKWAIAWRLLREKHGVDYNGTDTDGWMVGWFANAMATAETRALGGSFLNADGIQSILDGEIEGRPELFR